MIEAVRGHLLLEELDLRMNSITNDGCDALATLLQDPNCNLQKLLLPNNDIDNKGAIVLAVSLANNTKLKHLDLGSNHPDRAFQSLELQNPIDYKVDDVFSRLLCNTTSVYDLKSSVGTFQSWLVSQQRV